MNITPISQNRQNFCMAMKTPLGGDVAEYFAKKAARVCADNTQEKNTKLLLDALDQFKKEQSSNTTHDSRFAMKNPESLQVELLEPGSDKVIDSYEVNDYEAYSIADQIKEINSSILGRSKAKETFKELYT